MEHGLSIATRLAAHPTSAISDALDELRIAGALSGIAAQRTGIGRVCGRALPVRFVRRANDPDAYRFGGGVGKPLEIVLQTMRAGDFVVMDLDGATNASAWGGLASRLAQRRGVRGTILWGTCRDLEEIRAVGYPVWAVGVCPRRSRNEFAFGSINQAITIGGIVIGPGDYVVADESGAVCVPHARGEEIVALVERIEAQERVLEQQVRDDAVSSWDEV
ncbi:MAG: RraA family protein [Betaproteobacteria bacterium]|nr:RraA family protein [Betaproteobacteria bacterium]MCC7216290.1 RraA family protein [Burkholderiales bacterium]